MTDRFDEKTANIVDGYMLLDDTLLTSEVAAEVVEDGNEKFLYSPKESNEDVEEDDIIYVDEVELQEEADMHQNDDSHLLEEELHFEEFHEVSNESEVYLLHQNGSENQLLENTTNVEDNEIEENLTHTLHMRRNSRDGVDYYYCGQCQVDYDSIEEFSRCHAQEEAAEYDEVIEQDFNVVNIETEKETELKPNINELIHSIRYEEKINYNAKSEEKLKEALIKQEFLDDENSDKFFCYECHVVFNDFQTAEDHECSPQTTESALNDDYDSIFKAREAHCVFCQARLKTYAGLQTHQLNCRMKPPSLQAPPEEYKCQTCFKLLPTAKALISHERHHKMPVKDTNDEIKCAICSTVFRSYKNLKLHQKIHDKKPIKSIQEALPYGAALEYNESNKFYCEICNKNFDQNLLVVHKNMHQNVEEFNCGICNKQFENMPSYEMHMQLHAEKKHEPRGKTKAELAGVKLPFPCQYCGREFARPNEKVKHERIHTGEKPYECEVCGKTFRVSYSLTLHLRSHTDIRPYVCATCNKRFKSQPVYAHHLNTHLAERPYKCNVCPKSFRTSVQLCGHKNSHSKPFNCTECNRPFATLYAVKIHMKTHCKSNKSSENLKHRCTVCGAVYARIFALRFHMKEQHLMELGDDVAELELNNTDAVGAADVVTSSVDLDDEDAAILIAAATAASDNAIRVIGTENNCRQHQNCYNEDEISTQAILQSDEIIVDNFHTEEIVTDW